MTTAQELHALHKGKPISAKTYYPNPFQKELVEVSGTCLAVMDGTYGPLVIMEVERDGVVVDVIDLHAGRTSINNPPYGEPV